MMTIKAMNLAVEGYAVRPYAAVSRRIQGFSLDRQMYFDDGGPSLAVRYCLAVKVQGDGLRWVWRVTGAWRLSYVGEVIRDTEVDQPGP